MPETQANVPPQLSQTLVQVFVPTVNSKFAIPAVLEDTLRFASLNLHSVKTCARVKAAAQPANACLALDSPR